MIFLWGEIMFKKPTNNRSQLKWSKFEKKNGSHSLNLIPYYSELFEHLYPDLMEKSNTGWRESKTGKTKYAFFTDLEDNEIKKIEYFISSYEKIVLLNKCKNIENDFDEELDFNLALNWNANSPEELSRNLRTKEGEAIYILKNKDNEEKSVISNKINYITNEILEKICILPIPKSNFTYNLSYIPPKPGRSKYLPYIIVKEVASKALSILNLDKTEPIIESKLLIDKPLFKDLNWKKKVPSWNHIIELDGIQLLSSVEEKNIIIIDDLYQSGATMWSYAKYLKSQGAANVIGISCVKTLRDSDNIK